MADSRSGRPALNPAGRLAKLFLHSKLTPLMAVAATLFGLLAILATPRTYNPEIVVPVVNISVSRPGSNAQEMLDQVVRPLEALMAAIPGVDHSYGMARDDSAMVTVRFRVGQDEERSLVKVYNQLNSHLDSMPPGTALPLVQSVSLYDVPLVTLTLSSARYDALQLRRIAAHLMQQLRSVPGVGKSWIAGVPPPAVRVWLDPARLAAQHMPLPQLLAALSANNTALEAGRLANDDRELPLRVSAELLNADDVGSVVVGVWQDKPVFLRDVARISTAPANDDVASLLAFGPAAGKAQAVGQPQTAVTLALARQQGSNGVQVADALLARLHAIEQAALPEGVTLTVTRNYGADADDAVNTLIEHLGISILAVVAILLVFLGWREASVVTLSIPLILFVVLGIGWISGQTINRITLFALILSLGLLVDDSIVVIENIHRHLHRSRERNFGRLVVAAANEIGKPTIIATFTVILALIPMAFVSGMMGPFMAPIPFNAPIAMLVSLLIAYTIVPYVAYRWLKSRARGVWAEAAAPTLEERDAQPQDWLHRSYTRLFRPLMNSRRRRRWFLAVVAALLLLALLQPLWQLIRPGGANGPLSTFGVALKMLPDDNVNTLLVEIDSPAGTALEATGRAAAAVGAVLARDRYVTDYQTFLGEAAPEDFAALVRGDPERRGGDFAQIRVNLTDKHARASGSHRIAQQLYAELAPLRSAFPGTRIKIFETPPGPPVRSQMEAALYGPDYTELEHLANRIRDGYYPRVYGMINVDDSVPADVPGFRVAVDRSAAALAGLSPARIARQVQAYFGGVTAGSVHAPGALEPEDIVLRLPAAARTSPAALGNLYLLNDQNRPVVLLSVAQLEPALEDKPIYTRDQHAVVYLGGEMLHSSPVYAVVSLTNGLRGLKLPDGSRLQVGNLGFTPSQSQDLRHYQLFWEGEMRLTLDVFRDLGTAFMVALLLIYLLLVGYYRSFFMPLVVMGAIPLTLIGVFPGHWLLGQPFTATSMIGVIALAGIVVRNSLLLIDFIIERRHQGHALETAVLEAGAVRLRPILLTALAIILGSAVMLSDPVFGGLAIALMFGALASTVLTLFVIPLVYLSWQRRMGKKAAG
ncbi:MAG: efflux RND transporter permease subunit [Gammaproteobacteria bacterium]|nr:efflux RND transporter permease subunit [Gammaproteobacteria bacterium]